MLRVVEQFRSIEKKIFKKYRNEQIFNEKLKDNHNELLYKLYQRVQEEDILVIEKSGDKADDSLYLDTEEIAELLTEEEVD